MTTTVITVLIILGLFIGFIWAMNHLSNQMDYFLGPTMPYKDMEEPKTIETPVEKRKCKPYDTRPFTQGEYDIIVSKYQDFMEYNKTSSHVLTQIDISLYLNGLLGLDKSVTSYRSVWSGKVKKESLPTAR